jgi:hypothetical protein
MTIALIAALIAAMVLAAIAVGTGRHWLAVPAVAVVAATIALGLVMPPSGADPRWLSLTLAIALAGVGVLAGSPLVALVLRFAQGGAELGDHGGIVVDDPDDAQPRREILRGGATIGYLERAVMLAV